MKSEELNKLTPVDKEQLRIVRAPGRANLIRSHTDYSEGYVLRCTINKDVIMAAQPAPSKVTLRSIDLHTTIAFSMQDITFNTRDGWGNYSRGVTHHLLRSGYKVD